MSEPRPIPRITHQIWFQGWDVIPEKFKKNSETLATLNPTYKHMQWDETSLRHECGKLGQEVVAKFDSFSLMIQKIDLGRYVVLYNYGGITVDTDMVSLKPIDETPGIETDALIVSMAGFPYNWLGYANNALLIAKAHHFIIQEIIQTIVSNTTSSEDIYNTTGPLLINNIITKYPDSIIKLHNRYYEPCSLHYSMVCSPSKDTIMDHQHDTFWWNPFSKFIHLIFLIICYLLVFLIPIGMLYGLFILFQKYHILPHMFKKIRRATF